jgi:hypothetical protein
VGQGSGQTAKGGADRLATLLLRRAEDSDVSDEPYGDGEDFEEPEEGFLAEPLDHHEADLVQQDLDDLADFEAAFAPEGYRGVAVWCTDCVEEHYYPWAMLRENLTLLLETGETPVHEPAFAPEPDRYVNWEYARGYVDALRDAGVAERRTVDQCSRCSLDLEGLAGSANFCPRCGNPLLRQRLADALEGAGLGPDEVEAVLRQTGMPG